MLTTARFGFRMNDGERDRAPGQAAEMTTKRASCLNGIDIKLHPGARLHVIVY